MSMIQVFARVCNRVSRFQIGHYRAGTQVEYLKSVKGALAYNSKFPADHFKGQEYGPNYG